ncbi:pseudaminic acid cytidylyltransferase [Oceaniglobus roseus]|uniref:pseudaminic acid cytidylyltransferase n=1 Tax=Oceaniglobus roseus TaxID=1737570 RepID=UPI000C7EB420|nr:pseudaminic acid cytidylyltransferase [Kandeliimicrobium roseum]
MSVCLIPARGGSKRIPRKNVRPFAGRPMIAWPIQAARAAGFGRILVSTDDEGIAEVARTEGAEVPFLRPVALSDDHATTIAVVRHALDWLEGEGALPEALCCLYATAPFVKAEDLARGREMLAGAEWVIPVTGYGFPIQRAVRITPEGRLAMFDAAQYATRSQDLEPAYHDAGQFYWARTAAWRSDAPPFGPGTLPLVLPRWRVQDIDTEEDWDRAERMFQVLTERGDL